MIAARDRYDTLLLRVLEAGRALLCEGRDAVATVRHCVTLLEDDELLNAGRGSVLNERGEVELDAAIMDGSDLSAGAIAGVRGIRNPVLLADCVRARSEHVFLAGEGAEAFARVHGIETAPPEYFRTPEREAQWKAARDANVVTLDHAVVGEKKFGTVGAVACDSSGAVAAATSTGGIVNKAYGRIGDSAVIGAGTYADNAAGAVSCTGIGEHFLRTALAHEIAVYLRTSGEDPAQAAAERGIAHLVARVDGKGGVIVVDRFGRCGIAHSTPHMVAASIEHGGASTIHRAE